MQNVNTAGDWLVLLSMTVGPMVLYWLYAAALLNSHYAVGALKPSGRLVAMIAGQLVALPYLWVLVAFGPRQTWQAVGDLWHLGFIGGLFAAEALLALASPLATVGTLLLIRHRGALAT